MSSKKLYGYCDESGNSGLNLFDEKQPYFWVGMLMSEKELEKAESVRMQKILGGIMETELHGNKMGLGKIDQIASDIIKILEDNKCYCTFVCIEKIFFAKLKMFDYIFDSANNKAVSNIHYAIRTLRIMLANQFCNILTTQDAKEFWQLYDNLDSTKVRKLLLKIKTNISDIQIDERSKELILDAVSWAEQHPMKVFDTKKGKIDSPNVVAFSQILLSINDKYGKGNIQIERIFHDEQNEFGNSLKVMFNHMHMIEPDYNAMSIFANINKVDVYKNDLEIVSSKNNYGVQLMDVLLYLVKRKVQDNIENFRNCKELLEKVMLDGELIELSQNAIDKESKNLYFEVMNKPCSSIQIQQGKQLFDEFEVRRKSNMR